jgi:hypothetical protein
VRRGARRRLSVVKPSITEESRSAESHVDLTGVLFVVWGGLTILIGASTLALGIAAAALLVSGHGGRGQLAASFTAIAFIVLSLLALLWGAVHVSVGVVVRRRRHWSRLAAICLGSIDLLLLPYGTALGIYALWVLLREDSKVLFEV